MGFQQGPRGAAVGDAAGRVGQQGNSPINQAGVVVGQAGLDSVDGGETLDAVGAGDHGRPQRECLHHLHLHAAGRAGSVEHHVERVKVRDDVGHVVQKLDIGPGGQAAQRGAGRAADDAEPHAGHCAGESPARAA